LSQEDAAVVEGGLSPDVFFEACEALFYRL